MKSFDLKKIKSTFIKSNNRQQAGLSCLASVIRYYGGNAEIQKLLKNSGASVASVSLLGLCKAARSEGFEANGYKGNISFLKEQENPLILHVEKESGNADFVVVYGWQNNKFIIGDPQWGIIEYIEEELKAVWKSESLMMLEPWKSFRSAKDIKQVKKERLLNLFKSQKNNLILNGIVEMLLAIFFVMILNAMFNVTELPITVKSIMDFGILAVRLFLYFLAFITIVLIKNSISNRGIKSLINVFCHHVAASIFASSPDRGKQSAGIINSLFDAVQQFSNALVKLVSDVTFYGILFITAFVYVSIQLVLAGAFIFVSSGALIVFVWLKSKIISQFSVMGYQAEIQKTDTLTNIFNFYKYIQLTNSEKTFSSATENVLNISNETGKKLMTEKNKITVWFVIFSASMVLVVFGFLLSDGYKNQISNYHLMGWLIAYLWGLNRFVNIVIEYFQLKISFNFLYDFLGNGLPNAENNFDELLNSHVRPITNFSANKLSFSYPGKLPVFQNISFIAEKGKIMAIYGRSGSGKSTMVSVLNRLLPLESGDIIVDGKSWLSFNNLQWRKNSSTVLQPVQLFNSSILENIGWGDKSQDQEKIIAYCKLTGLDKFFAKLPDGYATNCNIISAGQKQMVALAAAIYRKPEILLLDEPLAYMDNEMKEFCWQLFRQLKSEMLIMIFTGNREWAKMADNTLSL